jgi:hypothetical protein
MVLFGFKDTEGAKKALRVYITSSSTDTHCMFLFAGRGTTNEPETKSTDPTSSKNRTTKMIVINVPFEVQGRMYRVDHADLYFLNLYPIAPVVKQRMHMQYYAIHIFLIDILF